MEINFFTRILGQLRAKFWNVVLLHSKKHLQKPEWAIGDTMLTRVNKHYYKFENDDVKLRFTILLDEYPNDFDPSIYGQLNKDYSGGMFMDHDDAEEQILELYYQFNQNFVHFSRADYHNKNHVDQSMEKKLIEFVSNIKSVYTNVFATLIFPATRESYSLQEAIFVSSRDVLKPRDWVLNDSEIALSKTYIEEHWGEDDLMNEIVIEDDADCTPLFDWIMEMGIFFEEMPIGYDYKILTKTEQSNEIMGTFEFPSELNEVVRAYVSLYCQYDIEIIGDFMHLTERESNKVIVLKRCDIYSFSKIHTVLPPGNVNLEDVHKFRHSIKREFAQQLLEDLKEIDDGEVYCIVIESGSTELEEATYETESVIYGGIPGYENAVQQLAALMNSNEWKIHVDEHLQENSLPKLVA